MLVPEQESQRRRTGAVLETAVGTIGVDHDEVVVTHGRMSHELA